VKGVEEMEMKKLFEGEVKEDDGQQGQRKKQGFSFNPFMECVAGL